MSGTQDRGHARDRRRDRPRLLLALALPGWWPVSGAAGTRMLIAIAAIVLYSTLDNRF